MTQVTRRRTCLPICDDTYVVSVDTRHDNRFRVSKNLDGERLQEINIQLDLVTYGYHTFDQTPRFLVIQSKLGR